MANSANNTNVAVAATSTLVLDIGQRSNIEIFNTSAVDIYLAFDAPAVLLKGMLLKATTGRISLDNVNHKNLINLPIYGISTSGTNTISITTV